MNQPFVSTHSLVRKIWSTPDLVLFIFAGSAAEFALNKAVDWLYFTGKLPGDPLGRMFSTIEYAAMIIFAEEQSALAAIRKITAIHNDVENKRGSSIPDWAYRDVLYMLIHYTIAAWELTERPMTKVEKDDVYDVFYRMGTNMGLSALPESYAGWLADRNIHILNDLAAGNYTKDLFQKYLLHLGHFRYHVMLEVQLRLLPKQVAALLSMQGSFFYRNLLASYLAFRKLRVVKTFSDLLVPDAYRNQLKRMERMGLHHAF